MDTSRVLLQALSIGRETEFKIYLKRQDSLDGRDPFKLIQLPNGVGCYDAELECGNGFVSKRILFFLLDENSQDFYDALSTYTDSRQLPESLLLKFGDKYPLSLFPSVFCHRKNVFITLDMEKQKIALENLPAVLAEGGDAHCSNCQYSTECHSNQNSSSSLSYFNKEICGVFAIDYLPVNLILLSQLISCVDESEKIKLQKSYLGNSAIFDDIQYIPDLISQSEINIAKLTVHKLKLIKILLDTFIRSNTEDLDFESCFKYDNVFCDTTKPDSLSFGILPSSEKKPLEKAVYLKEVKQGSVRLLDDNEDVRIELRTKLSESFTPKQDETIVIVLQAFDGETFHIEARVIACELDFLVLKLVNEKQKKDLTQFFAEQYQEVYLPVKYYPMAERMSFSEQLFLLIANILFRNSILGEEEIFHLKEVLFTSLESDVSKLIYSDILELVNSRSALSVVLRQENLLYKPRTKVAMKLSSYHWGSILLWLLQLVDKAKSYSQNKDWRLNYWSNASDSLSTLINELSVCVGNNKMSLGDEINEDELIKSALSSMIDDRQWLESVLSKKTSTSQLLEDGVVADSSELENTLVMPEMAVTKIMMEEETLLQKKMGNE